MTTKGESTKGTDMDEQRRAELNPCPLCGEREDIEVAPRRHHVFLTNLGSANLDALERGERRLAV